MKFAERKGTMVVGAAMLSLVSVLFALGQSTETPKQKWLLKSIDGKAVAETKAFIEIDNEKGRFTGHTGCNRMFGGITVNEKLKFGAVGTTRMFCGDEENRIESAFLSELGKITTINEGGSTLDMLDGSRVALSFKSSAADSTVRLDDKKWVLESIKGVNVSLGKDLPFVNFETAKGQLGGNTGCNLFGGSFITTGSKFHASQMISTMRACEEDGRMTIERQFLDGIENADRFEIKNEKLLLYSKDELTLVFVASKK